MAEMKINNRAHTAPQPLQRRPRLGPLDIEQADHLAKCLFADGEQQLFLVLIVTVDRHGRTSDFGPNAPHGDTLIPFAREQFTRGVPDLVAQRGPGTRSRAPYRWAAFLCKGHRGSFCHYVYTVHIGLSRMPFGFTNLLHRQVFAVMSYRLEPKAWASGAALNQKRGQKRPIRSVCCASLVSSHDSSAIADAHRP